MKSINELGRLRPDIKKKIHQAVSDCIDSGWYVLGSNVAAFEREFAAYIGSDHCISLANGTQALEIALKSLEIKRNDEVITTANAGYYNSCAILACGAKPVYADINAIDYTMDPDSLERRITKKTRAVIATHLYGMIGDILSIAAICKKNDLLLIEDCAQAHGAVKSRKKAGTFGDCACFSFYPTKNLGAIGDGGAITTSDTGQMEIIRQLRQYGWRRKYQVETPGGTNSRLDEIQAAALRVKLRYLDDWNEARRRIARRYSCDISNKAILGLPRDFSGKYVAHLYVIRTRFRDLLMEHLKSKNIPTEIHYPIPDHRQKTLAGKYTGTKLPVTEMVCSQILTLPCFPEMTDPEVDSVIDAVNSWETP